MKVVAVAASGFLRVATFRETATLPSKLMQGVHYLAALEEAYSDGN